MFLEYKKAFEKITKQYKKNENEIISDNYYLIQTAYENLERTKNLKKYPRLFVAAKEFTEKNNFEFTKENYKNFMLKLGNTLELDKPTLDLMPSVLAACVITAIANDSENIPLGVEMLRKITKTDLSTLNGTLYVSEKFLETEEMYDVMTPETKDHYRNAFSQYAKKHNLTHKEAEQTILSSGKPLGSILFPERKNITFFALTIAFFIPCFVILVNLVGYLSLLFWLPLWLTLGEVSDQLISKFAKKEPTLRVVADKCDNIGKTLVITTSLIGDNEKLFENIELFYLANKTASAYFGLLLDHPDSTSETDEKSEELTEKAKRKIIELNERYGERFFLFLRKRVKNEDGKYYGWERKRGAVIELVRFIYGEETTITHFVGKRNDLGKVKYLLTLDSDTLLTLESVNEIVGAMAHPHYRPIVEKGRVKKGFGIMQPKMVPTLESSSKTPFSSMLSVGGTDIYESASYDRYMNTFGEGAFCGKGIIDVELFHKLVKLPEGFVLSHDLPEGAIMRTRSLCDVTLSDSTPKNMLSFSTRAARWCRGDIQNLWLWNKVSGVGRFMMLSNVARLLCPILSTAAILFSLFCENISSSVVTPITLSILVFSQLVSILMTPSYFLRLFRRRTFSKIMKNSLKQLCQIAHKVLSLCYVASVNLISALRSVVRMTITKKKRLEWITASEIDKSGKGGFWYFVQRMISSCAVGTVLFLFAEDITTKLLGISWFLYPVISYNTSLPKKERKKRNDDSEIKSEINRMYRFFAENVGEMTGELPPDNISFYPSERVAMRTSPTNVGLYLLSTICARELGTITDSEMYSRLEKTLRTLQRLDKWHGHLYNWYDLTTLTPLSDYVSTVDSGNFITSIVAVVESLRDYGYKSLADEYEIFTKADMTKLYNDERNLFYLGCNTKNETYGDICYDLYMSEARTTSYFACASGDVPKKHWKTLSRILTENNGYIGMSSWTGTAFEYFMPPLLLPHKDNTFPKESLNFAFETQRSFSFGGIYGISESGYNHFDHEMNYQYKAFGVPSLSLKHYTENEYVFSPYSTYLMASLNETAAKENLKRLARLGAYGKYGFYEAVDMREGRATVVKSYMAHHVGMSICALANILTDNLLQKRFMQNKNMKCAHELLEERIPDIGTYKKPPHDHPQKYTVYETESTTVTDGASEVQALALENGGLTVIATSNGCISLRKGETLINDCNFTLPSSDKTIGFGLTDEIKVIQNNNTISFISPEKNKSASVSIIENCFKIKMCSTSEKNFFHLDVVLERENDFYSHSSFSRLFVTSEYDEKENVLFFIRRSRRTKKNTYLAITRADATAFSFKTRRDGEYGELGGTLYPSLLAEAKVGEKETTFLLSVANDKTEALENVRRARKNNGSSMSREFSPLTKKLLCNIVFKSYSLGKTELKRNALYKYGISGDFPIIFLHHPSPSRFCEYLNAFRELMAMGLRCELVVAAEDEDEYTSENTRRYKMLASRLGLEHFLSKRGGVFVLKNVNVEMLKFISLFSVNERVPILPKTELVDTKIPPKDPPKCVTLMTNGGYFTENGYTVFCDQIKDTKWSFILAGVAFGTVLTNDSLGFSYYLNSKSGRLTDFSGDIYSNLLGERILVKKESECFDPIKCASTMYVTPDLVTYNGKYDDLEYNVYVSVSEKYPIKYIRFVTAKSLELEYRVLPSDKESTLTESGIAVSMMKSLALCVGVIGGSEYSSSDGIKVKTEGNDVTFFLIGGKNEKFCELLRERVTSEFYERDMVHTKTPLPPIKMHFGAKWLDVFVNRFLPYQIIASRFRAKSGYFQSSGAFGYRDQLQDIMALCYSDTNIARTHIIRCSARQYEDGSVNHWFFPNAEGVKTKCSDDFIYLPLAVSHYISLTNDPSLLEVRTEYLTSSPLGDRSERFELPQKSGVRETVYDHCKRALRYSLKRGIHGLPPLGSCDWNDGFSHFGEKGLGESVLNAMQYVYVYEKFIPLMRMKSDIDAELFEFETKKLRSAVNKCFENDRFIRAYGDNGEKLGSVECDECKIDLTVQAFSVLANIGTKEMQKKALDTMWRELFDEKMMVLRLFAPSFVKNDRHIGYIQGYIEGIRENGGQYTHAAVWGMIAFAEFGMIERAVTLLKALCPSWRQSVGGKITSVYKSEPYALCGDVYYSPKFKGRGGWSHYTGSAGWYYRAILETIMGIKLENNFKTITVMPKVEFETELCYHGKVKIIAKVGKNHVLLDGNETSFPITLDGKDHLIEVFAEKIYGIDR